MKKLLCAILCLTMLLSVFLVPVGAANVDVNSDSVAWNDTCLKIHTDAYTQGHVRTVFNTGVITEDSTVSFYFKWDKETAAVQRSFSFCLVNTIAGANDQTAYAGEGNTKIVAQIASGAYTGSNIDGATYYGTNLKVGDSGYAHVAPDVWHRIDMVVDFTNGTMTGYIDYNKIGSVALANADNGYTGLLIPNNGSSKPNKIGYIDNLMISKGTAAPVRGDLASNSSVTALKASANNILYFDNFDTKTAAAALGVGYYWNPIGVDIVSGGIIPQNGGAQFRGVHQSAVDGTYNIRFLGTIDSLNYETVGFKIALDGGKTKTDCAEYVYDSVIGANGVEETVTYSALGTYGAGYIYASTITGLSATGTYTFTVTPFTVDAEGTPTEYASYTVSCVNGTVTASAN